MSWLPAQSTAGRWRTVLEENFTGFTGFFPESDLKQAYDAKLEDIRIAVKNSAPDSGSNLYSTLNDIARDNATSNGPLSNVAQEYRDGSGGATINTLMSDADFKDRPDIIGALQNDYIID